MKKLGLGSSQRLVLVVVGLSFVASWFLGSFFFPLSPKVSQVSAQSSSDTTSSDTNSSGSSSGNATESSESILGSLEVRQDTQRIPQQGIQVIVSQDGTEIGRSTSNELGNWSVPVPGPGTYKARIDTSTFPEGVGLTDPNREELTNIEVRDGQNKRVLFRLGPGVTSTQSRSELFVNLVFEGIRLGAIIALCAVGLSLVYGVSRLVNFAHGELVTMGALVAYLLHVSPAGPQISLLLAVVPTMAICAVIGGGLEIGLWKPLRDRKTNIVSLSIVSLGLAQLLRYLFATIFGTDTRSYVDYSVQDPLDWGIVSLPPKSLIIIIVSIALLALLGLFLQVTRMGVGIRAVAANPQLASVAGINVPNVMLSIWLIGSAYTALGGIFLGISEKVDWQMGFRLLLLMFAAIILGGIGTAFGAMVGGFLTGIIVEVSVFWVDSEFKLVIGLGLLIIMLLVRPQGLLGQRERLA